MTVTDEASGRPGSAADLSRRMDRLEAAHEAQTREVTSLAGTVARMELNQAHAEELNRLRFSALDTSIGNLTTDLKSFMARIEGMIDGTVQTAQSRQGAEMVADYLKWRKEVDDRLTIVWPESKKREIEDRLDAQDVRNGRLDLIGKVVWGLVAGNVVVIIGFFAWLAAGQRGL